MDAVFSLLHPTVAAWCDEHLGTPTPPQAQAIPLATDAAGATLICSPTGTGKTLAAFLPVMSRLASLRDTDTLYPRPYCLYVSPLRALSYDVEVNLRRPLREMGLLERPNSERAVLRRGRIREQFVRTGVRTGDTPVEERRLMISRPPHVLITTPESLALMIAMESYRRTLRMVETVIVDEVHALAGNKRGVQLSLLLEQLEELAGKPLRRVGLSATVSPLDRVASFLAGTDRPCGIVDCRGLRSIKLEVTAPFAGAMAPLATAAKAMLQLTNGVRSTLIFTNVRSQAERIAHEMENAGRPEAPGDPSTTLGVTKATDAPPSSQAKSSESRNADCGTAGCSATIEDRGCRSTPLAMTSATAPAPSSVTAPAPSSVTAPPLSSRAQSSESRNADCGTAGYSATIEDRGSRSTTLAMTEVTEAVPSSRAKSSESHTELIEPQQYTAVRDRTIGVHHSALERNVRHRVEAGLRAGTLRTVVCSTSLELGVDIGYIDRVLLLGGARGMTSTLQRVGRAGHRPDAVASGIVVAQDRDDIIEAAATRRCIAAGMIEDVQIPEAPLDVLAQFLVGLAVPDRRVEFDAALALARRALPYRDLSEVDLRACVDYLSGRGAGPDEAHTRRIGADDDAFYGLGRDVSAAYFENIGTIPDEQTVSVHSGGQGIGRLDESFASGLREGDVFLLEGRTLRVKEIGPHGLRVEAHVGKPNVPQWSSHIKGVPPLLAREIGALRRGVADALAEGGPQRALAYLRSRYKLTGVEATHVVRYIAQQRALSEIPDERRAVVELYRMDGRQTAVFHTCAGRRVNETLARIVGARITRDYRINAQLTTDDNGFLIALPARRTLPDTVWAGMLSSANFDHDLLAGLRSSYMLRAHFRYVANTGLLVLRRAGGRTLRRGALAWNASKIFDRLFSADRSFPLIRETIRVVTRDLLDAPAARAYLDGLEGEPHVIHPVAATPFTFGIVTSSFGDTVAVDDRAAMIEALHERVLSVLGEAPERPPEPETVPYDKHGQPMLLR